MGKIQPIAGSIRAPGLPAIIDNTRITIGPREAAAILAAYGYEKQRALRVPPERDGHILTLAMSMEQGTFRSKTSLAFGRVNGALHLVDGQHRLRAVELSYVPIEFSIVVHDVTSTAELQQLYTTFDTVIKKRTTPQIIRSTSLFDDDVEGISPAMARLLYDAMPLILLGFRPTAQSMWPAAIRNIDSRVQFAVPFKPAARLYQDCLEAAQRTAPRRFRSAGAASVALAVLSHQPRQGEAFWRYCIANDGLKVGDPRQTLHLEFLAQSERRRGGAFEIASIAAAAWNACYEKRPLKIVRAQPGQIRICGTPYGQRQR